MHESMFWTNWSGFLVAALLCLLTGQATEGTAFCARHPEVLNAILIYSVASAVGQTFIYYTITQFNPLVLTTVTTTRKIFTTVYSVFRNPANRLALGQWAGCSLVFVGILMDIAVEARGLPLMRRRPCMHRSAARATPLFTPRAAPSFTGALPSPEAQGLDHARQDAQGASARRSRG